MLFKINLQSSVWFHHRINFRKDRKIGVVYVQCTLSGVGGGCHHGKHCFGDDCVDGQ